MWPFKQIKNWFFPREYLDYRDSLRGLIEYLPAGNLEALVAWRNTHILYRSDTGTGKPDGRYDPLQNYNGADLTIREKSGDCESIAAVYSEVIRQWAGWESWHVAFFFPNPDEGGKYSGHDVAVFFTPDLRQGWIDGGVHYGGYEDMYAFYQAEGWVIEDWWVANDIGQNTRSLI